MLINGILNTGGGFYRLLSDKTRTQIRSVYEFTDRSIFMNSKKFIKRTRATSGYQYLFCAAVLKMVYMVDPFICNRDTGPPKIKVVLLGYGSGGYYMGTLIDREQCP